MFLFFCSFSQNTQKIEILGYLVYNLDEIAKKREAQCMINKSAERIIVTGGYPLSGEIAISGAKNAVLPIIAGCLLSEGECVLKDVPKLADVYIIKAVLESLGCKIDFENNIMTVDASEIKTYEAEPGLMQKMRASVLILGPLLARFGHAKVALPGGCAIGSRPVDMHLRGLEELGAIIKLTDEGVIAEVNGRLKGAELFLKFPSVGATENLMMAAVLAEGTTVIKNAALEPEIVDLAIFLNEMGANIKGAGTKTITIYGVSKLSGARHRIIPDRIEAGSYLLAGAMTGSEITINNCIIEHLEPIIEKMRDFGADFIIDKMKNKITIKKMQGFKAIDLTTLPHPGFPTDIQAQFMAVLSLASGTSNFEETIFENRYMHVEELRKLGANIQVDGRVAHVQGVKKLVGAEVFATDLRAGAALIIAGLVAEGETVIGNLYHIDRGYEDLIGKMQKLGAKIKRVDKI